MATKNPSIQNESSTRKTEQKITVISKDKQPDSKEKKESEQLVNRWKSYLAVPAQRSPPKQPVTTPSNSSSSYCTEDDEYYTTDSEDQQLIPQAPKETFQTRDMCVKLNPESISKSSPDRKKVKWDLNKLKLPASMNQQSLNQISAVKQTSAKQKSKTEASGQRNVHQIQNPPNTQPIQSPCQSNFDRVQPGNQIANPRENLMYKQQTHSQILNQNIKSEHANQTSIPQMQIQCDGRILYPAYQSNVQEIPIQYQSQFQNIPNLYLHQQSQRPEGNSYNRSHQEQPSLPKNQQANGFRLNHPMYERSSQEMHQYRNQPNLPQKQVQPHDLPTNRSTTQQFQRYENQNWTSANQGAVPLTLEQMPVQMPCNLSDQQNYKHMMQLHGTQLLSEAVPLNDQDFNKISLPNNYQASQFTEGGVSYWYLPPNHTFINKPSPNPMVAQQTHINKQNEKSLKKQTELRKRKASQSNVIKQELNFIAAPPVVLTPEYLMQKIETSPSTPEKRQMSADEIEKIESSTEKIAQFHSLAGTKEKTDYSLMFKAETVQHYLREAVHPSTAYSKANSLSRTRDNEKTNSKKEAKLGVLCLEAGPTKKLKLLESKLNAANEENYIVYQKEPSVEEQNNKQSKVENRLKDDTKKSNDSESYKIALIYRKGYKKYLMQKYLDTEMQQTRIALNNATRTEPRTGKSEQNNYNENTSLMMEKTSDHIPSVLNFLDTPQYFHHLGLANVQLSNVTTMKPIDDAFENRQISILNSLTTTSQLKSDHAALADNHLYNDQVSSAACEINNALTRSNAIVKTNSKNSLSFDNNQKYPIQLNSELTTSDDKTLVKHLKINSQKSQNIDNTKENSTIPSTDVHDTQHDEENSENDNIAADPRRLSDNSLQSPVQEAEFLYSLDLLNVTKDSNVGLNLPVTESEMTENSKLPIYRSSYCTVHEILTELEFPTTANTTNAVLLNTDTTEKQQEMTENTNVPNDYSDSFSYSSYGEIRDMMTDYKLPTNAEELSESFFMYLLRDRL